MRSERTPCFRVTARTVWIGLVIQAASKSGERIPQPTTRDPALIRGQAHPLRPFLSVNILDVALLNLAWKIGRRMSSSGYYRR